MRFFFAALRWSAAVGVFAGMATLLQSMAWKDLWAALGQIPPAILSLAILLNGVNLVAKGVAWWVLMTKRPGLPVSVVVRYSAGAAALSALLPLRAGEALRVGLLRKHHHVALKELIAVAVAEKLLDVSALAALTVPWLLASDLPSGLGPWRPVFVGVVGGVMLATAAWFAVAAMGRRRHAASSTLPRGRLTRLSCFFAPSCLAAALAVLLMGWLADLWLVQWLLGAVGLEDSSATALAVLVALNAAIALPSTPGQVGALELGAAGALTWMGAETAPAMAFALVYHAVQLLPLWVYFILDGPFFWRMTRHTETPPGSLAQL